MKHIPKFILIHGKKYFYVSKDIMKKLYDADLHRGCYVGYNDNYFVNPEKLSPEGVLFLKKLNVTLK